MTAAPPSLNSNSLNGLKVQEQQHQQHIWLVTGPAGCGKTTVAEYLAQSLGVPYIEGDSVCTSQDFSLLWPTPSITTNTDFS
jgi:gluconokinase